MAMMPATPDTSDSSSDDGRLRASGYRERGRVAHAAASIRCAEAERSSEADRGWQSRIAEATNEVEMPNAVIIDDRVQIDVATMLVLSQKGPYPLECFGEKVEG